MLSAYAEVCISVGMWQRDARTHNGDEVKKLIISFEKKLATKAPLLLGG